MLRSLLLMFLAWTVFSTPAHAQEDPTAVLKVTASVPGALIHLDNEELGAAPLTRYTSVGKHTLRVTADGYDPFVRMINLSEGQTLNMNAVLDPGGNTADISVTPGGADIEINGQATGLRTPTRLSGLQAGTYNYRITKAGYEPMEGSFTLERGGNPLVAGELLTSAGRFEVTSKPAGAQVFIDGEPMGVTPLSLEGVEPGVHQVGLVMDGYALTVREVDTSDGSKGEVSARLKDKGPTLRVNTGSADAVVRLDGVPIGQGKKVKVMASRGSYQLQVDAPDAALAETTAKLPPNGSVLYAANLAEDNSMVAETTPLLKRWTFWAGVGGAAAVAAGGTSAIVVATRPEPPPEGDVVVTMP